MKKLFYISIVIAILAAFFASANPDGLDFVSEKFGFAVKGQSRTAPMADYSLPFIGNPGLSSASAGVIGILLTFGAFWTTAKLSRKIR